MCSKELYNSIGARQEEDDYSGYRVDNQFRWLKLGRSFIPIKTIQRNAFPPSFAVFQLSDQLYR